MMRHPEYDGHKFVQHLDGNQKVYAITCVIHRRDRQHPIEMTEYLSECMSDTDPEKWPVRMLHHKAFIQTSRYAFGMMALSTTTKRTESATQSPCGRSLNRGNSRIASFGRYAGAET